MNAADDEFKNARNADSEQCIKDLAFPFFELRLDC